MELSNLPQGQRDLLDSLRDAIVAIDEEKARNVAEAIVNEEMDPNTAIRYSIAHAAVKVGEKFDSGEYYLSDQIGEKKVIVIGTVQGDMHSVGKNLVSTMLKSGGFQVHDMGVDVASMAFIDRAKEVNADMIALSSLLTTTMPYQKEVIDDLASMGLREKFKVIVGGGPVTEHYAKEIGADGYEPKPAKKSRRRNGIWSSSTP